MKAYELQVRTEAIRLLRESGLFKAEISRRLNISYGSVCEWVKRYEEYGEEGLLPNYSSCGSRPRFSQKAVNAAVKYKRKHQKWGAPFILLKLEDEFSGQLLPKARRLQQIFREKNLQPPRTRLPNGRGDWATEVFERVQVDAKEDLRTADGKPCCYLNFTDEYSGADLDAFVFPLCPYQ